MPETADQEDQSIFHLRDQHKMQNFMERMETVEWGCGDCGSTAEKERKARKKRGQKEEPESKKPNGGGGERESDRQTEIRAGGLRTSRKLVWIDQDMQNAYGFRLMSKEN
jgi:hypothetical protein